MARMTMTTRVVLACLVLALLLAEAPRPALAARAPHVRRRRQPPGGADPGDSALPAPTLVRLALAGADPELQQPTGMTVSWTTAANTNASVVVYGTGSPSNLTARAVGPGPAERYLYTFHHHVTLLDLEPGTTYYYKCGTDGAMSETFSFKTAPDVRKSANASEHGFTVAVWGDMGAGNCSNATRGMIQTMSDKFDFVWHLGDIAYQDDYLFLDFAYERILDEYMQEMEFTSARKPYMVLPGNHEVDCHAIICILDKTYRESLHNFTAYNTRWRMPSRESGGVMNMWYSFNYGNVHFVNLDAETDFPNAYEGEHDEFYLLDSGHFNPTPNAFLEWLERDLQQAAAQRHVRPWIVVGAHRPMYIFKNASILREAVEDLLSKYQVDLFVSGHIHSSYRTFPVYNGSFTTDYAKRDGKIVNIVAGGPGAIDRPMEESQEEGEAGKSLFSWGKSLFDGASGIIRRWTWEGLGTWVGKQLYEGVIPRLTGSPHFGPGREEVSKKDLEFVAYHSDEKMFGLLHILDDKTLKWEFISGISGQVLDSITLTK